LAARPRDIGQIEFGQAGAEAAVRAISGVGQDQARAAERNTPRFVLMAVEDYERLSRRGEDPRRVIDLRDPPDDFREMLLAAIDAEIPDDGSEW